MPQEFQPSTASVSPLEQVKRRLSKIRKACDLLEQHVETHGVPPAWVMERLAQAEKLFALAASYVAFADGKRFKTASKTEKRK